MSETLPYRDASDPRNGSAYYTGKPCIERGCGRPAGTAWSPLWCHPCNVERMDRISASLAEIGTRFERKGGERDRWHICPQCKGDPVPLSQVIAEARAAAPPDDATALDAAIQQMAPTPGEPAPVYEAHQLLRACRAYHAARTREPGEARWAAPICPDCGTPTRTPDGARTPCIRNWHETEAGRKAFGEDTR